MIIMMYLNKWIKVLTKDTTKTKINQSWCATWPKLSIFLNILLIKKHPTCYIWKIFLLSNTLLQLKNRSFSVDCSLWAATVLQAAWTASVEPTWLPRLFAGSGYSSRWSPAGFSGAEVGAGICSSRACNAPVEERAGRKDERRQRGDILQSQYRKMRILWSTFSWSHPCNHAQFVKPNIKENRRVYRAELRTMNSGEIKH